ncbi:MAG: hypothetical protein N5P05_000088 [Chroococcopsis gigantea SAG 12.99]|jgi:polysaccharide pyruvyl transferase CsaB|nr:polysaccharide pyruvyl transferase CsaB [Chlorogloea purpurea SAG 13.99]MDV2998482.1 hypothetical protein [Chroococcopsis gigantea SAG 12.99]
MKAVICGYYGKGNGGDEALLVTLLQMLPPGVTPIVLSNNPALTSQSYSVETCGSRDWPMVWKTFKSADVFIWGGGSLMQDVTGRLSPAYYAGLMTLAQRLGLKTIAWAQGIGPLEHSLTRWATRTTLQECTAVSVRDYASAELVANWNIKAIIAPDPVWALESKPIQGLWDLPAPRIAVNLRPHSSLTPSRLGAIGEALKDLQKATGAFILLVPFQLSQDLALAQTLSGYLPGGSYEIIKLKDPRQLKGLFRGVEMTIGMRYHSLIMAAAEDCRCFALSYDPKVSRLMTEVGLTGWEMSDIPDDPHLISRAWLDFYANGEPLAPAKKESLIDRALMHRDILRVRI